ncbi:MAG: hypothetical protein ACP5U2_05985, partial [Bryobacteraceae bacterium]
MVVALLAVVLMIALNSLAVRITGTYAGMGAAMQSPRLQVAPEKHAPERQRSTPGVSNVPAGAPGETPVEAARRSPVSFSLAWLEGLLLAGVVVGLVWGLAAAWIRWLEISGHKTSESAGDSNPMRGFPASAGARVRRRSAQPEGGWLVGASGFEPPTSWSRTRRS